MIINRTFYMIIFGVTLLWTPQLNAQDGTDLYGNNIYEEPDLYNNSTPNNLVSEIPNEVTTDSTCGASQPANSCVCSDCDCSTIATNFNGNPCPADTPCSIACEGAAVPLDGGASILLLLGGMFGAKKAYDYSKKEKEE